MSKRPVLYALDFSPPVRSVYLTAREIGLELDIQQVDLLSGAHLKPEFLKINPQHTVPTLDDNGFYLWDSQAICTYLIGQYAKNDDLYPKDLKLRAIIDQRLHFNSGILFPRLRSMGFPIFFQKKYDYLPENVVAVDEAYDLLEAILVANNKPYLAGEKITIADLACITNVTQMDICFTPIDPVKYPKIIAWVERMKQLPYYEELNGQHLTSVAKVLNTCIENNRKEAGK